MNDVEPHLYTTVIRELIRHENDVTNHRIMWLLIGQGLIANAYVSAGAAAGDVVTILAPVGILVTLSAFVILYKSYQARGYLQFLGGQAKLGTLKEQQLPLFGWPDKRIKNWRKKVWISSWLGQPSHLLEPYFFLPALLMVAWLFVLIHHWFKLNTGLLLVLSFLLVAIILLGFCFLWVRSEAKNEME
jgi:hypothetical protein